MKNPVTCSVLSPPKRNVSLAACAEMQYLHPGEGICCVAQPLREGGALSGKNTYPLHPRVYKQQLGTMNTLSRD